MRDEHQNHIIAVRCDECHQVVAQVIAGAIVIKERHFGGKHVTVITAERLYGMSDQNLRNSIKAV